jgi:streptomycin 6-kinase
MLFNPKFISNIREIYSSKGEDWLNKLDGLIEQLSTKRCFKFIKSFPDLTYNFVGLVEFYSNNELAVIKISPEGGNIHSEIKWLNSLDRGVPKIYFHSTEDHAFVMEYLRPGIPLKSLVYARKDDEATRIICKIIRDLQTHQHPESKFQHIGEFVNSLSILDGKFNPKLLSQAKTLFHELTLDRSQDIVLHGDLHHDNILSCETGWKAIDPHGYLGDPAAEVGVMIRNPMDSFPTDHSLSFIVERRLRILADELPFDPQKIKYWTFCMTVLSAAWTLEGHGKVTELEAEIASAINKVKI